MVDELEMNDSAFTLFYAWQSDTPSNIGRNFVEKAASKALKEIHATGILEKAPRLDKDTKDIPGMPDIANTILEKIKSSSAFLADLTFIGKDVIRDEKDAKLLPNPNVLLELGYAIAHLGWERIICVMNTNYGGQDELPFDLKHRRWPLFFSLSPEAKPDERKTVKAKIIKDLEGAISSIAKLPPRRTHNVENRLDDIESLVVSMSQTLSQIPEMRSAIDRIQNTVVQTEEDQNSPENRGRATLNKLVERVQNKTFEDIDYTQGMLGLVVFPVSQPTQALPLSNMEDQIRIKLRPLYTSGWDYRRYGTRFITYSKWDDRMDTVSEISEEGIISAAGHEVISVNRNYFKVDRPKEIHVIPSVAFESSIIEAVHSYINLLLEFGISGPWIVAMSLFNLQTSILYVGTRFSFDGSPFKGDAITPPPLLVSEETKTDNPQNIARALRPNFDFIWREHNYPQSLNYGTSGDWTGR